MGGSSSKPPPPPEITVEHRNQLQSPTSNTVSSGFHMLELHGQTMTTVLTVLICAAIWAVMTWKAGMWRIRRRTKKEQKWREEMDRMEGGRTSFQCTTTRTKPEQPRGVFSGRGGRETRCNQKPGGRGNQPGPYTRHLYRRRCRLEPSYHLQRQFRNSKPRRRKQCGQSCP